MKVKLGRGQRRSRRPVHLKRGEQWVQTEAWRAGQRLRRRAVLLARLVDGWDASYGVGVSPPQAVVYQAMRQVEKELGHGN